MGTAYSGKLQIYGNEKIGLVIDEAANRLQKVRNSKGNFKLEEIKEVFFGSKNAVTDGKIGCRDLELELFSKCIGKRSLQYEIFFSTDYGYPDYFATYLVEHLKKVDPSAWIFLDCVGDGIYKVKESFR